MIASSRNVVGYAYTCDLCTAIEHYTAGETKRDCNAFYYRGMNLKYAVERHLYIQCINSAPLFSFYANLQNGATDPKAEPLKQLEADIAREFPRIVNIVPVVRFESSNLPGHFLLRWAFRQLRAFWQNIRWRREVYYASHPPVLFHVVHPKFATYLKPITRLLDPDQYAYLITVNPNFSSTLESQGEPYVLGKRWSNSMYSAFLTKTMRRFDGLVGIVDCVYATIRQTRPRCVVVAEGNAPLDIITAEVCKKFSIPTLCVQQGWSPVVHTGFRNMSFDEMFVWGEEFVRLLAPSNPCQRFTVTGSHAIQAHDKSRNNVRSTPTTISFFLQAPSALLDAKGYEDFIDFIVWCARDYPAVRFVVREHPSYSIPSALRARMNEYNNIVFSSPIKDVLADVIRESSLVVSVFSTILLESVALGTVPLICSIGSMPCYEPDLNDAGAAIEVHSVVAAKQVINRVICEPDYLDRYKTRLTTVSAQYFSKGDAARAISSRIKAAASLPCTLTNDMTGSQHSEQKATNHTH